jgi:hypothetical protein
MPAIHAENILAKCAQVVILLVLSRLALVANVGARRIGRVQMEI